MSTGLRIPQLLGGQGSIHRHSTFYSSGGAQVDAPLLVELHENWVSEPRQRRSRNLLELDSRWGVSSHAGIPWHSPSPSHSLLRSGLPEVGGSSKEDSRRAELAQPTEPAGQLIVLLNGRVALGWIVLTGDGVGKR